MKTDFYFSGENIGVLVFGRVILKTMPQASIEFCLQPKDQSLHEEDFWEEGIQHILKNITRFGRIAIVCDRKNFQAQKKIAKFLEIDFIESYQPKDKHRAEKNYKIQLFTFPILREMALEGLGKSVEFRRLARKYFRTLKNNNIDTVFFCENIYGEESTQKTIRSLLGTQLQPLFISDIFSQKITEYKVNTFKRSIILPKTEDQDFVRKRAEQILRTKLSK